LVIGQVAGLIAYFKAQNQTFRDDRHAFDPADVPGIGRLALDNVELKAKARCHDFSWMG
jgi:hypothetical protein